MGWMPTGAARTASDGDDRHQQGQRRDEAPDPAQVEPRQPQRVGCDQLSEQQQRDHESRDHEEHVDADEPAREPGPGVEEDDQHHGEGAQALDVPAPRHRCRRCGGARSVRRRPQHGAQPSVAGTERDLRHIDGETLIALVSHAMSPPTIDLREPAPEGRVREGRVEDTVGRILGATTTCLERFGVAKTTVDDVAAKPVARGPPSTATSRTALPSSAPRSTPSWRASRKRCGTPLSA